MARVAQRLMVAVFPKARIGRPLHRHDVINALRRCRAPFAHAMLAQRMRAPERLRVLLPSPAVAACIRCCARRIVSLPVRALVQVAAPAALGEHRTPDFSAWTWC